MEEITQLFDIQQLLLLVAFPLIALGLNAFFKKKQISYIKVASLTFLIPALFGYDFIISWFYELSLSVFFATLLASFFQKTDNLSQNMTVSFILGALLFLVIGLASYIDAFLGRQIIGKSWRKGNYKVQCVIDQGFAGKPLIKYEVYHTPLFGLYSKHVQTLSNDPNNGLDSCLFYFDDAKLLFDRCEGEIISTTQNSIYFDCEDTPNSLMITGRINNGFIPATSHKLDSPQRLETLNYIQAYQENKHEAKLDTYFALLHHHDSTRANNIIKADSILSKTNEFGMALVYTFEKMEQLDILFKPLIQSNQLDGLISCTVEQLNQLKPYLNSGKKVSLKVKLIGCAEMDYTVFYKLEDIQIKKNG